MQLARLIAALQEGLLCAAQGLGICIVQDVSVAGLTTALNIVKRVESFVTLLLGT